MNTLTTLPPELLSLIVDYVDLHKNLHNLTEVNTQLNDIVNRLLFTSVHLRGQKRGGRFIDCISHSLARDRVREQIRHVQLEGFLWTNKDLMRLQEHTPGLTSLVLDRASRITDTSIKRLVKEKYWPHLESLHLGNSRITHLSYSALGQLPHLVNLELLECPGLQHDTFSVHFVNSKLERLVLGTGESRAPHDPTDRLVATTNRTTTKIFDLTMLRYLTHLTVNGANLDMSHLQHSGSHWPNVTSVVFEKCSGMVDESAIPLVRGLPPGLTHLAMKGSSDCSGFTNRTLDTIATCQPNLLELDVSSNKKVTACGVRHLIYCCPYLVFVKLTSCGIVIHDFPEAGPQCTTAGSVLTFRDTLTCLDHLDAQAIGSIRRGNSGLGDGDEPRSRKIKTWL